MPKIPNREKDVRHDLGTIVICCHVKSYHLEGDRVPNLNNFLGIFTWQLYYICANFLSKFHYSILLSYCNLFCYYPLNIGMSYHTHFTWLDLNYICLIFNRFTL